VILPHRRDVQIDSVSMSQKHILVTERANASTRLVLYSIDAGGKMPTTRLKDGQPIEFEEEVYTLSGCA
jgi:protease II